jgi:hypothetical protein
LAKIFPRSGAASFLLPEAASSIASVAILASLRVLPS